MEDISQHFLREAARPPLESRRIVINAAETTLVALLDSLVAAHPTVKFGSYPDVAGSPQTVISVQGAAAAEVDEAVAGLVAGVSSRAVVRVQRGGAGWLGLTGDDD